MTAETDGDSYRIASLLTLIGGAFGVLFSVLCLTENTSEFGRTDIGVTAPLTLLTTAVGYGAGTHLARLISARPRSAGWVLAIGVLLLTALLGGIAGWIVGDAQSQNWVEHQKLTNRGTAVGALVGPLLGLVVLVPRWLKRRPRSASPD